MKKIKSIFTRSIALTLLLLFALCALSFKEHDSNDKSRNEARFETVIDMPIGSQSGAIAYSHRTDGMARGPQDFIVSSDGSISVLDTMNQRIQVFRDGEFDHELDISSINGSIWAQAFDFYEGSFYILDLFGDCIAVIDDKTGSTCTLPLPEKYDSGNFYDLTAESGSIILHGVDDTHSPVDFMMQIGDAPFVSSRKPALFTKTTPDFSVTAAFNAQTITRRDGVSWMVDTASSNAVSVIGADSDGVLYVNHYERVTGTSLILSERTIRAYDKNGNVLGYARIDTENTEAFPLHNTFVTENGELYLMVCLKDHAEIQRVTLGSAYTSDILELHAEARRIESEPKYTAKEEQEENFIPNSITREELQDDAFAMAKLEWYLAPGNNETDNNKVTVPDHIKKANIGDMLKGVPYCVGQYTTLDRFTELQPLGYTTGNVSKGGYGRQPGTIGVDCSGFATVIYRLTQYHNTGAFKNFGTQIVPSATVSAVQALQPMDYLLRRDVHGMANHMMLFLSCDDGYYRIVDSDTEAQYDNSKVRWDRVSVHFDVEDNMRYYQGRSPYDMSYQTEEPTDPPIPTPEPMTIKGDINHNGILDPGDATIVLRCSVGAITLTDEEIEIIDMNGNFKADPADATLILRKVIEG